MTKKLWIIGAIGAGLLGVYLLSDESNMASAASSLNSSPVDKRKSQHHYGERTSLIEVKQALTTSALDGSSSLDLDAVLNATPFDQQNVAENPFDTFDGYYPYDLTAVTPQPKVDAANNSKPIINLSVEQQLQTIIYGWELTQNKPISNSLSLNQLFEDPDGDLLTTRIWLENANGLQVLNQGQIVVQGAPEEIDQTTYLAVAARDNHHGEEDYAWVTTRFELPVVKEEQNNTDHPLVGDIVYRLETTQNLGGIAYAYEVVYCEAFQFENEEVYFAASNNKRLCPEKGALKKVGHYKISDDSLIVSANGARQIWTTKKVYPSQVHKETQNYFTTVFDGKQFESYTMQKNKQSMEKRINAPTGRYLYQISFFDYLLPRPNGDYLVAEIGNYIYHHGTQVIGPHGESIDSDLNLRTYNPNLYCADVAIWYGSHVIAGQGDYQVDIISDPNPYDPTYLIDCYEYISNPTTRQQSLAFDLSYSPYDELLDGEVYSYILRPKPELADRVEEFKINMIYHNPKPPRSSNKK
ncbi:hypothetical protein ACJO15_04020 [Vibrio parahaemolyticus]|uniref:hypothetical protein n=1 Tax=Vibrio parahaemolyticus TaxID=670 RepID=UPI000400A0A8|nr:hypothetical protein [Vibrio parahaemolyticus]MEA5296657.1 hypothetical protein [Vibrio parahaemolyticus]